MVDFKQFEVLSFDCYGTLIDWESGILKTLRAILAKRNINISDQQILELYAQQESLQEAGSYLRYRDILKEVVNYFGEELNFSPTKVEVNSLAESIKDWEPFPDTVSALQTLKKHYKLTIISNIDDDLFAHTAQKLGVEFDWVITAEQVKSYKPSLQNFEVALGRMKIAPETLLHVAQSIYHDIVPAKTLGLSAVWVNRRKNQEGFGATVPASGNPDLEVPDLTTLVSVMGLD
ncbi:MAG TPA: haloacid dehalogenase type II [Waterburya sp.]|jgi:2-haloacid dehalogenase